MAKQHILIVEDEKKIAELLRDYLENDGYAVSWLERGDRVVARVKKDPPELILLDIMLPGTDGVSVCREIRMFSNLPIIMLTAKVEEIDRILGLELGADDYICKPFSPREVVARVKAVLRRSSEKPEEKILHAGPLKLDEGMRQVTVDGEPLQLTPSEYDLLKVMLGRPDRVFSRAELIDLVQGYEFEGYERTIDSHIKNLRKKIGVRLPGRRVIHSVYGVGYKLVIPE